MLSRLKGKPTAVINSHSEIYNPGQCKPWLVFVFHFKKADYQERTVTAI